MIATMEQSPPKPAVEDPPLRRGWTTGACATAATKAALAALFGADFEDPVTITLPGGQQPAFALAYERRGEGFAEAGIIKDAGDDPDVTHGALVIARVETAPRGSGIGFHAGEGVGTVTKPGLPLAVGEPAINPVPRRMMREVAEAVCAHYGRPADLSITISVSEGARLAEKTWNPRLGILGGLSILGTTGIVVPYSCAAWIASVQRGVDVARALGLTHVVGATGDASEKAAMAHLGLPMEAYLDMGDFVGGLLKYLRTHPVKRVTIAGGFAKLTKLAQGAMDLHSARSTVDLDRLAEMLIGLGADTALVRQAHGANTANEVLGLAQTAALPLADAVAEAAKAEAEKLLRGSTKVGMLVVDRNGVIVGEAG
jgi:cobalt-precorrin-5B (C1)-methyltransferase